MKKSKHRLGWLLLVVIAILPALAPAPQQLVQPKVGELKDLADARVKICEKMLDYYRESLKAPPAPGDPAKSPAERYAAGYEPIQLWTRRLIDAKLDGAADLTGRSRILNDEIDRLKKIEAELNKIAEAEPEWKILVDSMTFDRLEVEYRLAKEKAKR